MTISAILFGSIGTLVETSEHQRHAFNRAFRDSGLAWDWDQATYRDLLAVSGGQNRIRLYAERTGEVLDVAEVHRLKTQHFENGMEIGGLEPRPGVLDVMRWAASEGMKTAFVTSTSQENIDTTFKALGNTLTADDFDLVTNATMVAASKPAPDIYNYALDRLGIDAVDAIAIEDTEKSLKAPVAAGVRTIAFPGANTLTQNYGAAIDVVDRLSPELFATADEHAQAA